MKTLKTIAFYLAIMLLLLAGMVIDLSAGNKYHNRNYPRTFIKLSNVPAKHANRKQHRIYAQRANECRAYQYRIQSSGQTHHVWVNQKSKLSK